MELRVLGYFLAVAREESISGAANALHLSQPTLSRQLKDMEAELGKQLFIRGGKKIELTDEGRILKKRAEEIIALVEKTENEIAVSDEHISGDVFIGAGETVGVRHLTKAAKRAATEQTLPNGSTAVWWISVWCSAVWTKRSTSQFKYPTATFGAY